MLRVAILDDYAGAALTSADWSVLSNIAEVEVFREHLSEQRAVQALASFDILCTLRERMALPRTLIERLPRLKLVTIVGMSLPNLDLDAATDHGVLVIHSDHDRPEFARIANSTPELAWGLMIASVRNLVREDRRMRQGEWQDSAGIILAGRTLGLLGLGKIGRRMAEYGRVFGMEVIAWSENLTSADAAEIGVRRVEKDELFEDADIVSVHLRLSERSRGLIAARELGLMKPTSHLVNTSRGPIIDEAALVAALCDRRIAGAALDAFDEEPLPPDHPLRTLDNVTLSPHLGYVTRETLAAFYGDTPAAIAAYASGIPIRVVNRQALAHQRHSRYIAS